MATLVRRRVLDGCERAGDASAGGALPTRGVSMRAVGGLLSSNRAADAATVALLPRSSGNAAFARLLGNAQAAGPAPDDLVEQIDRRRGSGRPLPAAVLIEAESALGHPLGDVRIHDDAESAALAARLGARAFTVGSDIFFNTAEFRPSTPDGFELLVHELTHTLQRSGGADGRALDPALRVSRPDDPDERVAYQFAAQARAARAAPDAVPAPGPVPAVLAQPPAVVSVSAVPPAVRAGSGSFRAGPVLHRAAAAPAAESSLTGLVPDFIVDGLHTAATAIPGYTMLTQIIGTDPMTHRPVTVGPQQLVESVLTFGPFGAATGRVLAAARVLEPVLDAVQARLAAHRLTLTRIGQEVEQAWDELSVAAGVDANVATVRRHVDVLLADARAAVAELVDQVIQLVRSVAADLAEPLLRRPDVRQLWDLATKVLHHDPLRGVAVNAPTAEILADFLTAIGREQTLGQLRERGTLQEAADWLDTQFATFGEIRDEVVGLFADAWAAVAPQNLPDLLDTLPGLAQRAISVVRRIVGFGATILAKALELVRHSLLDSLGEHARCITGFPLLTVVIGQDPFTGEDVPRTVENLVRGFLTLLPGGDATYSRLAESGVLAQAVSRIEAETARLGITPALITGTFRGIWDTLSLDDLLDPVAAFQRILRQFGEPIRRIAEFVGVVVETIVTLILRAMNIPTDLLAAIVANVSAAIGDITRDPVRFLLNMVQALKTGFLAFLDGIGTHLLRGLGAWLLRGLGQLGVTVPTALTHGTVVELVLQVLGVDAEMLWQKLGARVGPDRAAALRSGVDRLAGAWAFIRDIEQQGVAGIVAHVGARLGTLWDTLLQIATDWIMTQVVQRATTKLMSMLDPTGVLAVINSCVAFFNAVESAVEYLRDILRIVEQYTHMLAQIARGNVTPAAERVTHGLAEAVPVAIGFLANQVGLGNVPEKIVEIIEGLRRFIDQAVEWLFDQAVRLGAAGLDALGVGGPRQEAQGQHEECAIADLVEVQPFDVGPEHHTVVACTDPADLVVRSSPTLISALAAQHPGSPLATEYARYVKHVGDFKAKVAQREAASPDKRALLETEARSLKAKADSALIAVAAAVKVLPGFSTAAPGCSAPNIGNIGRHGDQLRRLRGKQVQIPVWELESEHVLPFMSIAHALRAAGFDVKARDDHEDADDFMTTIVVYEDAADRKTNGSAGDLSKIAKFRDKLEAEKHEREEAEGLFDVAHVPGVSRRSATISAEWNAQLAELNYALFDFLAELGNDALGRLRQAVVTENTANGAARGPSGRPEPPIPPPARTRRALDDQLQDIRVIIERRMFKRIA